MSYTVTTAVLSKEIKLSSFSLHGSGFRVFIIGVLVIINDDFFFLGCSAGFQTTAIWFIPWS